jgi:NAD-specific glutamate dehydrogenase
VWFKPGLRRVWGHTVVEIVADDMPLLVDSASMVITDRGRADKGTVEARQSASSLGCPVRTAARSTTGHTLVVVDLAATSSSP